ncbi:hypothetical protein ZWY2020_004280 [Hordeum vulgare]|nr:hypothetical protein ZWY2020_004280 [Hordeum vulgare]
MQQARRVRPRGGHAPWLVGPLQKQKEKTTVRKTVRKYYAKPSNAGAPEARLYKKLGVKRAGKRIVHVVARKTSLYEDPTETAEAEDKEEILVVVPPPKKSKLIVDVMPKKPYDTKKSSAPKKPVAPKRTKKDIHAAEKNKGCASRDFLAEEDEDAPVLMKLRCHLPTHDASYLVVEDMKKRKDAWLREWRSIDSHDVRRRTHVDPRFHTREQQDFCEILLLGKNPAISDMRYVDWEYIKANEHYFPHVRENFMMVDIEDFVGKEMSAWNDEMIMRFYSAPYFYYGGRIVWITEGHRYESTMDEWATIIGAPKTREDDLDVCSQLQMNHNSMANMYKAVPNDYLLSHKLGSLYFLQARIPTTNTIMRHTLMPKSGDGVMIRGYSIHMIHHLDTHTRFRVMDLIVETVKRTTTD